jgi:hypothetical protein
MKSNFLFTFHHADVVVKNRFDYFAIHPEYTYKYKSQVIRFDKITVENAPSKSELQKRQISPYLRSIAYKNTLANDMIYLSKDFIYQGIGRIRICADKEYPIFSGFAKFDTTCNFKKVPVYPFQIEDVIVDPDSVMFSISEEQPTINGNVYTGLYWTKVKPSMPKYKISYPFVGKLTPPYTPIFKPSGKIYFNKKTGEYRIGPEEMLYSKQLDTLSGNIISYNKNLCLLQAQGQYNIFMDWRGDDKGNVKDKYFQATMRGFYRNNLKSKENFSQVFQVALGLNFLTLDKFMFALADSCKANENNPSIFDEDKLNRTRKNFNVFLGKEQNNAFFEELMSDPFDYHLPDSLNYTIMFSDVKFVYDYQTNSFHSVGLIGLSNVGGIKIDKYVKGYIKYVPDANNRKLIIILEPLPGIYFAFLYKYYESNNHYDMLLSSPNVNEYFSEIKDKEKNTKIIF